MHTFGRQCLHSLIKSFHNFAYSLCFRSHIIPKFNVIIEQHPFEGIGLLGSVNLLLFSSVKLISLLLLCVLTTVTSWYSRHICEVEILFQVRERTK